MKQENKHQGPLAGLTVIDFGHYYAGPMVGMMMADQGANVIRIVRPGERELREQQYRLLNRNKKLLKLDLKTEADLAQAKSLIERADVVIENFRPGTMKRLRLDYASFKVKNPGLIYLSLPGFASTDKERAPIRAWEGVMCAAAGLYRETSTIREQLGFPPLYHWPPQCSIYGGMLGMLSVAAALVSREEHGNGTFIEVPQVDAAALGLSMYFLSTSFGQRPSNSDEVPEHLKPYAYSPDDSREVQAEKLAKAAWKGMSGFPPTCGASRCADDRVVMHWPQMHATFEKRLLKALGIFDRLTREEGFVNAGAWESGLDNNISDGVTMSPERKKIMGRFLEEAFLTKTAEEWDKILGKAGVPASMVRSREEWLNQETMLNSGVLVELDNGKSKLIVPGRLADISGPGGEITINQYHEAEPISVAQLDELLRDKPMATASESGPSMVKKSDLLKGLKVLDLCNVAAGPVCGLMLAELGADVIKADQADPPTMFCPGLVVTAAVFSAGKRSILTDTKSGPGRKVFDKLLQWADVVIHNSVDDTAERLGISFAQMREINPNAVVCQLSAFGGTSLGGWEYRLGFDPILQAASGLMAQYGTLEDPQWYSNIASADILGAMSLGITASLASYQKRRTGRSCEGRASLARQINYIQLPFMIAENGKSEWGEARGQFTLGDHWWYRMYVCRDKKWIFAATTEEQAGELAELVLGKNTAGQSDIEQVLEAAFSEQESAYWVAKLQATDIGCHQVFNYTDFFNKFPSREVDNNGGEEFASGSSEILVWKERPWRLPITTLAPNYVRIGENHSWYRVPASKRVGEDTKTILLELGYSNEEIKKLIRLRAVHEYMPQLGSKDIYFLGQEKVNFFGKEISIDNTK